jgi:hypothetical protein
LPIELPSPTEQRIAKITKIEQKPAKDIFKDPKTGEYAGNLEYRKPDDKLYVFHGIVEGQTQEIRLGTANVPTPPHDNLTGSNLLQIINNTDLDRTKVTKLSDDLKELVGCKVKGVADSRGFFRLLPQRK